MSSNDTVLYPSMRKFTNIRVNLVNLSSQYAKDFVHYICKIQTAEYLAMSYPAIQLSKGYWYTFCLENGKSMVTGIDSKLHLLQSFSKLLNS